MVKTLHFTNYHLQEMASYYLSSFNELQISIFKIYLYSQIIVFGVNVNLLGFETMVIHNIYIN